MCGIAGVVRLTDRPIEPAQIKTLLIGLQVRGGDATGIATMAGDKVACLKDNKIAWQFCGDRRTDGFLEANLKADTDIVLLHTRSATKGQPWRMENNHPLTAGKSAVTHNGTIQNDDELFENLKLDRKAEVDSDVLRAIIDKEGITRDAIRTLKRVRGSCAIAAISPEFPNQFILGRAGSPLVLAYTEDYFIWASIKEPIYRAMRTWQQWHGLHFQAARADLRFAPMLRETIYLWDIKRLREDRDYEPWEEPFEVCKNYVAPCYRVHEKFPDKQRQFREAKEKEEREQAEKVRKAAEEAAKRIRNKQNVPGTAVVAEPREGGLVSDVPMPNGEMIVLKMKPDQIARKGQRYVCTNQSCGQLMQIGALNDGKKVWELECPRCHRLLADFDADERSIN